MSGWFTKLNRFLFRLKDSNWGLLILLIIAFADAAIIPLPVTTLFLIMILQDTKKSLQFVLTTVAGTVAGALVGYAIGHSVFIRPDGEFTAFVKFLFDNVPGFSREIYEKVHLLYLKWDFWIICIATTTPIPYSMFSITSGVFGLNIFIFFLTTLICQTIKHAVIVLFVLKISPALKKVLSFNWKPIAFIVSITILIAVVIRSFL